MPFNDTKFLKAKQGHNLMSIRLQVSLKFNTMYELQVLSSVNIDRQLHFKKRWYPFKTDDDPSMLNIFFLI